MVIYDYNQVWWVAVNTQELRKDGALTPVWLIYYATSLFMKGAIVILNGISNFNYDCLSHSYRGWRVVHRNLHYNELEGINNLGDILVILHRT